MTGANGPPPRLCVLIPLLDRQEYLPSALASVRASTGLDVPVEVLVVSNLADPELERLTVAQGGRWLPIEDRSLGGKLLAGLAASDAEVFALLDDDDEFEPDRLARVLRAFTADASLLYFHNAQRFIGPDGSPSAGDGFRAPPTSAESARSPVRIGPGSRAQGLARLPHREPDFNNSSIAVRRSVLETARPALPDLTAVDSFLFYTALTMDGSLEIVAAPLTRYRLHGSNISLRAGATGPAYLALLYASALRGRADYDRIAPFLLPRCDRTVGRSFRAHMAMNDLTVQLRAPHPARLRMLRTLLRLGRYAGTLPVRANHRAIGVGVGYLVAPRSAQSAYLARITRARPPRPGEEAAGPPSATGTGLD